MTDAPPLRPRRPLARRLLVAGILLLLLVAVVEAASFVLFWSTEGRPFTWSEARRLAALPGEARRNAEVRLRADAEATREEVAAAAALAPFQREESVHPFVGYVIDPDVMLLPDPPFQPLVVTEQGFFAFPRDLEPPPDGPRPLRVAIFGGSVAFLFSLDGREGLVRGLREGGVDPPGGVRVVSRALGGMKQPQQLGTFSWLLANGEHFDAVVVLDGFNELVISTVENVRSGINPHYPRSWHLRLLGLPDAEAQERLGEVIYLRRRRAEAAEGFAASPWSRTVTGTLLWRAADRRAAAEVAAAEARLAGPAEERLPFAARGPDVRFRSRGALYRRLAGTWASASRQMWEIADGHGIAYAHFLQPNQYVPGAKPLTAEEERVAFTPDHVYREPVLRGWRHFQAAGGRLAEAGVAFHDLSYLFADNRETLYFDDCCHMNGRGSNLMGEAIGRALAAELSKPGRVARDALE